MDRTRDRATLLSRRALLAVSLSAPFVLPARVESAPTEFCGTEVAELTRLLDRYNKYARSLPVLRYQVLQYLKKVNGRITMPCTEVRRLQELHRIHEFKRIIARNAQA